MAAHAVNLDALIPREDFAISTDSQSQQNPVGASIKLSELEPTSLTFTVLKKPDFQRETASWEPKKIMEVVHSFVDDDLIPSIILWQSASSRNVFVIDGAHRLSALIAWVHDDYGDGELSMRFFNNLIAPEQRKAASQTRVLIASEIGSYQTIKNAQQYQANSPEKDVIRAEQLPFVRLKCNGCAVMPAKQKPPFSRLIRRPPQLTQRNCEF